MITLRNVSKTYYLNAPKGRLPFASHRKNHAAESDASATDTPRVIEALKNVDFHVPPGSIHGVIGLSGRSEEHTSELQSRGHLVCRLLLEKKKKDTYGNKLGCHC